LTRSCSDVDSSSDVDDSAKQDSVPASVENLFRRCVVQLNSVVDAMSTINSTNAKPSKTCISIQSNLRFSMQYFQYVLGSFCSLHWKKLGEIDHDLLWR